MAHFAKAWASNVQELAIGVITSRCHVRSPLAQLNLTNQAKAALSAGENGLVVPRSSTKRRRTEGLSSTAWATTQSSRAEGPLNERVFRLCWTITGDIDCRVTMCYTIWEKERTLPVSHGEPCDAFHGAGFGILTQRAEIALCQCRWAAEGSRGGGDFKSSRKMRTDWPFEKRFTLDKEVVRCVVC